MNDTDDRPSIICGHCYDTHHSIDEVKKCASALPWASTEYDSETELTSVADEGENFFLTKMNINRHNLTKPDSEPFPKDHSFRKLSMDVVVEDGDEKTYLNVPYDDKDEAKALGAWWDTEKRLWYVGRTASPPAVATLLRKWGVEAQTIRKAEKLASNPPTVQDWGEAKRAEAEKKRGRGVFDDVDEVENKSNKSKRYQSGTLTKSGANDAPITEKTRNRDPRNSVDKVPEGHYALQIHDPEFDKEIGVWRFFKVDHGKEGTRWEGYLFLEQQAGGDYYKVTGARRKMILDMILKDPREAAVNYGHQLGRCSSCNRELTNPESIAAGIGPICAGKAGW